MKAATRSPVGALKNGLVRELYGTICGKLDGYRLDSDAFEARKGILPFVRGLRFSSLLIYQIRKILNRGAWTASWGMIVDENSGAHSPECDIVVHKNGCVHAWDGGDDVGGPVMDFRFVSKTDAVLVISCKQMVSSITAEIRKHAASLSTFVPRTWLFAERCEKRKINNLGKRSKAGGYGEFFFLYSFEQGLIGYEYNEKNWLRFVDVLRQVCDRS